MTGLNARQVDTTYIWPTNASTYLSSTFGETRSAHFHAGLDIKTWGREGYKAYATREGVLSRLLITNQGYGKAVYLRHPDSTYTVYAHLQRFSPSLQAISDSLRLPTHSYEMDAFLEKKNIKVQKGDVIGFTGSTGVGPPHLHYEIRNRNNEPVNALRSNLSVEDNIPPVFSSIMIEALSPGSTIRGSLYPAVVRPDSFANGTYYFEEIPVSGKVGISANVFDQSDHVTNRYAAYELLLLTEEDTLYHERINEFSFDQASDMFINRAAPPFNGRRGFQRLFLKDGHDHPFLLSHKELANALPHRRFTIIAKDIYGNTSTAVARFVPDSSSLNPEYQSLRGADPQRLADGYWTQDWIVLEDSVLIDLRTEQPLFHRPDARLQRILPKEQASLTTPDYTLSSRFQKDSFFDTVSVLQHYYLKNDTVFISIAGKSLPVKKELEIQFYTGRLFKDTAQLALYRRQDDGDLNYVDSRMSGNTLVAYPSEAGDFVVLRDTTSPTIRAAEMIQGAWGKPTVRIQTSDELSGINFSSAVFTVNGLRGIAEYDYESDEFTFYHPDLQLGSTNTIYFRVADRAGNTAEATFRL